MWSTLCATETIHANVIIRQTIINIYHVIIAIDLGPIHSSLPLYRDIMLTLTLGGCCESAFLMAKFLRHDSSDLNTKWYYRETDFGMSF